MSDVVHHLETEDTDERTRTIIDTLLDNSADLMVASPAAFRAKFRKMAADPFAFYRGSAWLFYADLARLEDPWVDERTRRVWIQGDLHAGNFGTSMAGDGALVFGVNDFDESYLGHFTWDIERLVASVALLGWAKAFSNAEIDDLVAGYVRSYLAAVRSFSGTRGEIELSLRRGTTTGVVHDALVRARHRNRETLLASLTEVEGEGRVFRDGAGVRRLGDEERVEVEAAFGRYRATIPRGKRLPDAAYTVVDVVGRSGFGIGSAGLPAYTVLVEGFDEALENDVLISMKRAVPPAPSRIVDDERTRSAFTDHGHRTATSQRALQAQADRFLGHTRIAGVGYVVAELSPYETDLDWDEVTEPEDAAEVLAHLGRATAKAHCVSDADAETDLVPFQVEDAVLAVLEGREADFVDAMTRFARRYAARVRDDHRLFVEAFRSDRIPGVTSTHRA